MKTNWENLYIIFSLKIYKSIECVYFKFKKYINALSPVTLALHHLANKKN